MKVGVYEAKSKLSEMIQKALDGENVTITRNGEEVIDLVPRKNRASKKKRRNIDWIGMYTDQIMIRDDFDEPLEEFEEYS
jgi:prevent-host-death family protein